MRATPYNGTYRITKSDVSRIRALLRKVDEGTYYVTLHSVSIPECDFPLSLGVEVDFDIYCNSIGVAHCDYTASNKTIKRVRQDLSTDSLIDEILEVQDVFDMEMRRTVEEIRFMTSIGFRYSDMRTCEIELGVYSLLVGRFLTNTPEEKGNPTEYFYLISLMRDELIDLQWYYGAKSMQDDGLYVLMNGLPFEVRESLFQRLPKSIQDACIQHENIES